MKLTEFPKMFRAYRWAGRHHDFGYPPDEYDAFQWMSSLEQRFEYMRKSFLARPTGAIYLFRELILWGDRKQGVLQKFEDGIGQERLQDLIGDVISNIEDTDEAIKSALKVSGLGLTYSSKLLRFLAPERYGALDSQIHKYIVEQEKVVGLPARLGKHNWVGSYSLFVEHLVNKAAKLNAAGPKFALPTNRLPSSRNAKWLPAHVEMAYFGKAMRFNLARRKSARKTK
jgi:hypothetical protein